MLFVIIAISVVLVVLLTAVLKLHPFLSLLIGAFFMGIASGMPLADVVLSVNEGFGGLMTSIGIGEACTSPRNTATCCCSCTAAAVRSCVPGANISTTR